jgi:hypothetical protein
MAQSTRKVMTWAHEGYLDGYHGREPNERLSGHHEYEDGWLQGSLDREADLPLPPSECPLKKGDEVTIKKGTPVHSTGRESKPAGRTYKVKVHHVLSSRQAHFDTEGRFVRPQSPEVVWAGTGGYWTWAKYEDLL